MCLPKTIILPFSKDFSCTFQIFTTRRIVFEIELEDLERILSSLIIASLLTASSSLLIDFSRE
jgi:hypothetical protein